jgi:hypothetical protein
MLVLPGLAAEPAVRGKFTALADKLRVRDSDSVALRAMVCGPEFSTWADAKDTAPTTIKAMTANRIRVFGADAKFIYEFSPLGSFFIFCSRP